MLLFQGQCFIAIDPNQFEEGFTNRMQTLIDECRNQPPVCIIKSKTNTNTLSEYFKIQYNNRRNREKIDTLIHIYMTVNFPVVIRHVVQ